MSKALTLAVSVLAGLVLSAVSTEATRIAQDQTSKHKRATIPVLLPTVHAAVLEAPVRSTTEQNTAEGNRFLNKIKNQLANLFSSAKSHNSTSKEHDAMVANSTDLTQEEYRNKSSSVDAEPVTSASNGPSMHNKGIVEGTRATKPLKATSADVVTAKMRLTSFIESISASLEGMHFALARAFWRRAKLPYEIKSRNETVLVAEVRGKRFFSAEGLQRVKPVRAVFHNHKLTVEVEESSFEEIKDSSNKIAEQVAGVGTEYHFAVDNSFVNVEDIYLRATNGETPGYEIIVPLRSDKGNRPETNSTAISRISARAMSSHPRILDGHWGTIHEEDEYNFLQSQMYCQKEHGYSGIQRMLCTCQRVHVESETRRLLCVSRVADKVVRVARNNGEERVATRVYRGSIRCRNARYGLSGSYNCLVKLLEKHSGKESRLHLKYGRSILSKEESSSEKVSKILAKEKLEMKDFIDVGDNEGEYAKDKSTMMQILMFMVYVVGLIFLLVCFFDVSQQYRRHNDSSPSSGRLSKLPEHAQALYARLCMRNE